MLTLAPESHVDHVSAEVLAHILVKFKDRTKFFYESIELPVDFNPVECGLHGPIMGDPPVLESEVVYASRPGRSHFSRLVDRPKRLTRTITVIAGPYMGNDCVLFTAFGGPGTPKEPTDPTLKEEEKEASEEFWEKHALSE